MASTRYRRSAQLGATTTILAAAIALPLATSAWAGSAAPAESTPSSMSGDRDTAAAPQLMINGDQPVSKAQGDLYAYAECPAGVQPGPLRTTQLGMPGDWYRIGGSGYWAELSVINAATSGTHTASVTCGSSQATTMFTIR